MSIKDGYMTFHSCALSVADAFAVGAFYSTCAHPFTHAHSLRLRNLPTCKNVLHKKKFTPAFFDAEIGMASALYLVWHTLMDICRLYYVQELI